MMAGLAVQVRETEPDEVVLRAAVAGDRQAQGAIARLYYPRMRRWALLESGDPMSAEEAVQEALVRWVRHSGTFDLSKPFTPWLRTLVRNACRDAKRGRWRVLEFLPWGRRAPDIERRVALSQAANKALSAFSQLTPRQREVVDLVDLQGLSAVEAAEELGMSPATARVHLHGAHKRLQGLMDGFSDVLKEEE